MRDYPKGVKAVYDIGENKCLDRYAVYFSDRKAWGWRVWTDRKMWPYVGMSADPFHPMGYGQHGEGMLGNQNGRMINFSDLPAPCQRLVMRDLEEIAIIKIKRLGRKTK